MIAGWFVATLTLAFGIVGVAAGQAKDSANSETAPPKLALLVYQKFAIGKAGERDKLLMATARAYERRSVPNSWIALDAITGEPKVLWFDPFDSFAHLEKAFSEWPLLYAADPELARLQQQISAALAGQETVIAVRREDLSYRSNAIDLSKARFMRVLDVRLRPGHENDFTEAFQKLSAAYEKIESDMPWVVYQVNVGMPSPSFLVFVPMTSLRQNDDLLSRRKLLQDAEGEEGSQRMQQIAREAYASTESNLYAVRPEMSHVSKAFAAANAEFWSPKPTATKTMAPAAQHSAVKKQN